MKGFLQRILQEIMKKKILGTSDAWSMRQSSHRPSVPAYYIEDCRISKQRQISRNSRHHPSCKSCFNSADYKKREPTFLHGTVAEN